MVFRNHYKCLILTKQCEQKLFQKLKYLKKLVIQTGLEIQNETFLVIYLKLWHPPSLFIDVSTIIFLT